METKLDIKFRLKQRLVTDPVTGKTVHSTRNVLITMRVVYGKLSMEFTTGYHINVECWDAISGFAVGASDGKSADEINNGLAWLAKSIRETAQLFDEKEKIPTSEEFKLAYSIIKDGIRSSSSENKTVKPKGRKTTLDNQDIEYPKQDKKRSKQTFNKLSEPKKEKADKKGLTFWDVYHEYEAYAGKLNDWSVKTRKKYETIRYNVKSFRDWKRKQGLTNFEVTFDYFDEDGLQSFVDYLRDIKMYVNSTIRKDVVMFKCVIRWAYRRRYHNNHYFEAYRPALKSAKQKVVFFNKHELEKLEKYDIPKSKLYLIRVRDVFLFQCYTGIRYSDLANLRRCDVHDDYIEITTVKTVDSLRIELNVHSKAILKKYEPFNFKDGKALPVVSNPKMNKYLHELCEMAGFDEPIRLTYYRGSKRIDEVKPKYEVIGTHTGRRSFICNALGMGISPQVVMKWTGQSDYKAMKPYIDVCDEIKAEAMKKFDDF